LHPTQITLFTATVAATLNMVILLVLAFWEHGGMGK
jgi:ABC-type sulfate transport system permease component